jgi:hypothetical protein
VDGSTIHGLVLATALGCLALASFYRQSVAIEQANGRANSPPPLILVDGSILAGTLTAIDERADATFVVEGKARTVPLAQVIRWGTPREPRRDALALLIDGGIVVGHPARCDGRVLSMASDTLGDVDLPLESVRAVVFRPPAEALQRDRRADRLLAASGEEDRLLVANGDELTGTLLSMTDEPGREDRRPVAAHDRGPRRRQPLVAEDDRR